MCTFMNIPVISDYENDVDNLFTYIYLSIIWWSKIDGRKKELQIWRESIAACFGGMLIPVSSFSEYSVLICLSQIQNVSYIKVTTFVLQNPAESAFTMHVKQTA